MSLHPTDQVNRPASSTNASPRPPLEVLPDLVKVWRPLWALVCASHDGVTIPNAYLDVRFGQTTMVVALPPALREEVSRVRRMEDMVALTIDRISRTVIGWELL